MTGLKLRDLAANGRRLWMVAFALPGLCCAGATAQPIEEVRVTAARLQEPETRAAFAVTTLMGEDMLATPALRLDEILKQVPGVSLFRRASSLVANPTTQGLALRWTGPNAASRALVLLDGMPLNDPFGGWIYWSAIDPATLGEAEVIRGGGSGALGNQALMGGLRLHSRRPTEPLELSASARRGEFDTTHLKANVGTKTGPLTLSVSGQYFDSDGFHIVPERQRGPVDVPAASDLASARGRAELALGEATTLSASLGWFEEDRVNGLALSTNHTDGIDASLGLVIDGGRDAASFQATMYWRDRDFANSFAAVFDEARSVERQVLDQFDVPGWEAGGMAVLRLPFMEDHLVEIGADVRRLSGNTNEAFRNLGDGFTRLREAGGDQWLAGGWLEYTGNTTERLSLAAGLRVDHWRSFNGVLRESVLPDGDVLRDDDLSGRNDTLLNGRLGATYDATGAIRLRGAAYSSFRLPTINEFFRPFRVGNDITRANPELDPERLYGLEIGIEYQPLNTLSASATYFRNWLEDGVGNVTLAQGPGVFPPAGFVPEGGSLRRRSNIDRIVADGVELAAEIRLARGLDAEIRYLFVDARVEDSDGFTVLEGKQVPQNAKHTLSAGLSWQPDERWQLTSRFRVETDRFEDDLNSRELDGAVTVDAAIRYALTDLLTLFLSAENLFDADVVSRIDGDGLITRAQRQFVSGGVRLRY